jgi:basic membrane lipoprotein Med (substrate-binding protein (PBP1-ABC) superfamily)
VQRRWWKVLAIVLGLSLLTAACGSDDNKTTDTTAGSDKTTTTAADGGSDSADSAVTLEDLCQQAKDDGVTAPDGFVARLVTDIGKIDDRTFNQYAYEGLKAVETCFGIDTSFIETASEADYAKNIATALEAGPDVVVTTGFLIGTDTLAAAKANTDTKFIGIDQFDNGGLDNYIGVQANEDEGGYMAGVLAASLSESGVIGVVAGKQSVPAVVKLVNGYEVGAKSVNPDIRVLSIYNADFNLPQVGASNAQQFIGEGADVIFGAGGKTGSGGVAEATKSGVWGIGVDQDEYFTTFNGGSAPGADKLATSAIKRVDVAVFANIVSALDGSFKGGLYVLTAENAGITYAPFHDADIPDAAAAAVEEARKGLADGSIKTGLDPATGLPK